MPWPDDLMAIPPLAEAQPVVPPAHLEDPVVQFPPPSWLEGLQQTVQQVSPPPAAQELPPLQVEFPPKSWLEGLQETVAPMARAGEVMAPGSAGPAASPPEDLLPPGQVGPAMAQAPDLMAPSAAEPQPAPGTAGGDASPSLPQPQNASEALAIQGVEREFNREQLGIQGKRDLLAEQQRQAEQDRRVYETAQYEAKQRQQRWDADVQMLSQRQIDRGRWWRNRDTGQKVAGFISAAIAGWQNPTGPNSTVQMILDQIDKDVGDQIEDIKTQQWGLNQEKGLIADLMEQNRSEFEAVQAFRVASYNRAIEDLGAQMQQYDPAGTLYQKAAETVQGLRAAAAKTAEDTRRWNAEQSYKWAQHHETVRSHRADEAIRVREQDLDAQEAQSKQGAEMNKELREKGLRDPNSPTGFMMDVKGNPIVTPTGEEGAKLRELQSNADGFIKGLDRLTEIYERAGWESSALGDDEAMEAQAIKNDLKFKYGVLSGQGAAGKDEFKNFDEVLGGDPTGLRDFRPKWKGLKNRLVQTVNARIENTTGQRANWKPQSLSVEGFDASRIEALPPARKSEIYNIALKNLKERSAQTGKPATKAELNAELSRVATELASRE